MYEYAHTYVRVCGHTYSIDKLAVGAKLVLSERADRLCVERERR